MGFSSLLPTPPLSPAILHSTTDDKPWTKMDSDIIVPQRPTRQKKSIFFRLGKNLSEKGEEKKYTETEHVHRIASNKIKSKSPALFFFFCMYSTLSHQRYNIIH